MSAGQHKPRSDPATLTLGVDVGGTFTDAVVLQTGAGAATELFTGKSPTTPEDQSIGVIAAAQAALEQAGAEAGAVKSFVHGMTVTTNAMLEADFARTALLATAGFTDIEELGRQNRPQLYHLDVGRAQPIVPRELRFALRERCTSSGVIEPLDEGSVHTAIDAIESSGVEAVAVCLLFSFLHPAHELRVGELLAERMPELHVVLSHQAVGTFREYERCATTVAAAALAPRLGVYMSKLCSRAHDAGLPEPQVMLSNGGTCAANDATGLAAHTVLSGPSGGAVGVAAHSRAEHSVPGMIGFDMGGTSTDVSLVEHGEVRVRPQREIAGRPVALPAVDVFTVGAGGGSIAWRDSGGALRVGPRSAGARPGPAAYGHGATEPTVTDANLLLGYLGEDSALAGGLRLDRDAAERAVDVLARSLDLDRTATAAGIVEIANLEMLRATASMTVARGIDPRDHTLAAFGGAGPMHAAAIATSLGIGRVLCPRACGVFSALGLALAGRRTDIVRSVVRSLDAIDDSGLHEITNKLVRDAHAALDDAQGAASAVTYDMRYRGQSFELQVEASAAITVPELRERFHAQHEREYGYSDFAAGVELVTIRASAFTPAASLPSPAAARGHEHGESRRDAWFDGAWHPTRVLRSDSLGDGEAVAGPAIAELPQATIVIPPGWRMTQQPANGSALLEHAEAAGSRN